MKQRTLSDTVAELQSDAHLGRTPVRHILLSRGISISVMSFEHCAKAEISGSHVTVPACSITIVSELQHLTRWGLLTNVSELLSTKLFGIKIRK